MSHSVRSLLEKLHSLKANDARVFLIEIRCGEQNPELADGLIAYFWNKCPRNIATCAVQAISVAGTQSNFPFMIEVVKRLSCIKRNGSDDNTFNSAIYGAGRLGMPCDASLLIQAGQPWAKSPAQPRKDPEEWIDTYLSEQVRREAILRFEEGQRFLFPMSKLVARAITMMLVKHDGQWVKDLLQDYTSRVISYSGPLGRGPLGLAQEATEIIQANGNDQYGFLAEVSSRIAHNMFQIAHEKLPVDHGRFMPASPPTRTPRRTKPRYCLECGARTITHLRDTTGYAKSSRIGDSLLDSITVAPDAKELLPKRSKGFGYCGRCVYFAFREWLIDVAGFSPKLWELPPKDSPVTAPQYSDGDSYWNEKQFEWQAGIYRPPREKERSQRLHNDEYLRLIRERGPDEGSWFYLMQHLAKWVQSHLAISAEGRTLTFTLSDAINGSRILPTKMLFELWKGEYFSTHQRNAKWIGEHVCLQIISELLDELPQRQWTTNWLINPSSGMPLRVDGYFNSHRLAVEYQGQQHFEPIGVFGGVDGFEATKQRDEMKARLLRKNRVRLLCVRYDQATRDEIRQMLADVLGTDCDVDRFAT